MMMQRDESPCPSDVEEGEEGADASAKPWPEWANRPEAVPVQQGISYAAQTSFLLRHKQEDVRMPPGFEYKKRPRDHPKVKKALDAQTALVCDAYLTNACLSTLFRETDLYCFTKCERHELLAAGGHIEYDPHAAPPRHFALTLCVPDTELHTARHALLDAMAFWARVEKMHSVERG